MPPRWGSCQYFQHFPEFHFVSPWANLLMRRTIPHAQHRRVLGIPASALYLGGHGSSTISRYQPSVTAYRYFFRKL